MSVIGTGVAIPRKRTLAGSGCASIVILTSPTANRFLLQAIRQQNNLRRMTEYADFDELSEARIQRACGEHIAILDALSRPSRKDGVGSINSHLAGNRPGSAN
ncbi:hypothetical protein [Allomesorhizobium camelthorni]|uniref:Uncharacterized protein n=1 Tax=Allomesorhizobium camelthorni TaxID=475069 RepID=A0A6G4WNN4_9HYPH|nr:hypothetical protein [Mesorhizobium camelthorni]NGO56254.1 hypothetical protein [Mesorhizobium camelthorni]